MNTELVELFFPAINFKLNKILCVNIICSRNFYMKVIKDSIENFTCISGQLRYSIKVKVRNKLARSRSETKLVDTEDKGDI